MDTSTLSLRGFAEDQLARADRQTAAAVNAAIEQDGRVPRGEVCATVLFGRVRLNGVVNYHYQRDAAIAVAQCVPGVLYVRNCITVRRPADA